MSGKIVLLLILLIVGCSISSVAAIHEDDYQNAYYTYSQWLEINGLSLSNCPSLDVAGEWADAYMYDCFAHDAKPIFDCHYIG